MWLDEEDRRERKIRLRHQRNRTFEREKKIERKIVVRVPEGATSPRRTSKVPDLVSRGDSSVDSSKDSNTLGLVHDSDGKMWADHPGLVPPDPEPPSESPTPRVVPPDDDVVDGNVANITPNRSADKAPREQSEPQWERDDKGRFKHKSINFRK